MRSSARFRRQLRRLRGRESGSAAVETVLAAILALGVSAAAADLGGTLRGQARLESAVRDAARMLTLTPLSEDGELLAEGVARARAELAARLEEAGLAPAPLPATPPGGRCDAAGAVCHRVEAIAGAEAALGGPQVLVSVWAGAQTPARVLSAVLPEGGAPESDGLAPGAARLTAALHQMHAR